MAVFSAPAPALSSSIPSFFASTATRLVVPLSSITTSM
ncbi:uncharacterized protein METZ01_LOCUS416196 [marine metagenome]|uniref:Uncharacterized protein n=1 Tax=marine metagenome TaxID=408172 RepID=A0A382WX08_9ZZZZ